MMKEAPGFVQVMKGFLFTACCFASYACFAQNNSNTTTMRGHIKGQDDGSLVLMYPNANGIFTRDTAAITNGRFAFTVQITEPVLASLSGKTKSRSIDDPNFTGFFIEPSKKLIIELTADHFKDITVKGSAVQDLYSKLIRSKKKIAEKYQQQLDSLRTEKDQEKNAEIKARLAPYFAELDQEDYRFFKAHPSSFVTAYMLRFHVAELSPDSLEGYYNRLGTEIQRSAYGRYIAEEIIKLRRGSPGSRAQDFVVTDINGNRLALSDLKGKYVLIDFWASWCVPCRKGSPHLKELYEKYKSKGFEIIGVADDDRATDAWRNAVAKDGTGLWRHVLRGLQYKNGNYDHSTDINEKYGIYSLPTRILVDQNGIIIGRFGEKEEELDKMLNRIFGS